MNISIDYYRYGAKKEFTGWGLSLEEITNLGERLVMFYKRFGQYFRTKTRDTSRYVKVCPANSRGFHKAAQLCAGATRPQGGGKRRNAHHSAIRGLAEASISVSMERSRGVL